LTISDDDGKAKHGAHGPYGTIRNLSQAHARLILNETSF
jgi:hypothetical protein